MSRDGMADLTLAGLTEAGRGEAMARLSVLRQHLEDGAPLAAGGRRLPRELVALIEDLGLMKPHASAAGIHRRIVAVAGKEGWRPPSYATVAAILTWLDPATGREMSREPREVTAGPSSCS